MIQCAQCGQGNVENAQYCRFCGNRLLASQPEPARRHDYRNEPPRPYAWKTDEYQTQTDRRVYSAPGTQPIDNAYATGQPLAYQSPQFAATSYRCPNCGTTALPIVERRISTAGWITFALLLVFTFIFFWIGLLIREDVRVCPMCRATLA